MKIDFVKVESILSNTLKKIYIEHLSELAILAGLIQDPAKVNVSLKATEEMMAAFERQLNKIKKKDPKFYAKLDFSPEDEKLLHTSIEKYSQADWSRIKHLKEKIEELKKELLGDAIPDQKLEEHVDRVRKSHIYKRFKIRDGWLPLH
jgi:16S rRNA C967 or C1407 C5-methylase (RsmB/RsmF family)